MLTSGGKPTCTAPPARVNPLRNRLRETRNRLVITCDIGRPSFSSKLRRAYHRDYHFLELKSRLLEILEGSTNQRPVSWRFGASCNKTEVLFHHTFLAQRAGCQDGAEFHRRGEARVG